MRVSRRLFSASSAEALLGRRLIEDSLFRFDAISVRIRFASDCRNVKEGCGETSKRANRFHRLLGGNNAGISVWSIWIRGVHKQYDFTPLSYLMAISYTKFRVNVCAATSSSVLAT